VSWNILLTAYAQTGHILDAVRTFCCMDLEGQSPVQVTYLAVLVAISQMGDLKLGKVIHNEIEAGDSSNSPEITTSLIDMYVKCGRLDDARSFFDGTYGISLGISSWNAMIGGYTRSANAENGYEEVAVRIWRWMDLEGISPDHVAFNSILFACSHGGLVRDAVDFFQRMTDGCDLLPEVDHYVCIVDLFARTGQLE
ncbi:hypothetical protein SELMODRAFT_16728, partial [Selaginella moellendorffii]